MIELFHHLLLKIWRLKNLAAPADNSCWEQSHHFSPWYREYVCELSETMAESWIRGMAVNDFLGFWSVISHI